LAFEETLRVSLLLQLDIPDLDWELAEQLMDRTRRTDALRVYGPRRRRWWSGKPYLLIEETLDDGTSVFDEDAVDDDAAAIAPSCREMLARTLLFLAEALQPGWRFHAGWVDDWDREVEIGAVELADLARHSQLDASVKYRVV
jgi:hypothetical protein